MTRALLAAILVAPLSPAVCQLAVPPTNATAFRDTSMLKPPAGAKLAIIEFEDLECYACGQASPIVWSAMKQYGIPRVHHDYLIRSHVWSRSAAISARYLQDKVSPAIAETYRHDVFASQQRINSRDDLQRFTSAWFKMHSVDLPFTFDASGLCAKEVEADCALGDRLGVHHTPTILVVTAKRWVEVTDPRQLFAAIDVAKASLNTESRR